MKRPFSVSPLSSHARGCHYELIRKLLNDGMPIRLRVTGMSMKPWIPPQSLIRVVPCKPATLRAGDIILLESSPGVLLTHRVVSLDGREVVTKGDSCRAPDAPHSVGSILGRVAAVEEPICREFNAVSHRLLGRLVATIYPFLVRAKSLWLCSVQTT